MLSRRILEQILNCACDMRSQSDIQGSGLHLWLAESEFEEYLENESKDLFLDVDIGEVDGWRKTAQLMIDSGICSPLHESGQCADMSVIFRVGENKHFILRPRRQALPDLDTSKHPCIGFPRHPILFEFVTGPLGRDISYVGATKQMLHTKIGSKLMQNIGEGLICRILSCVYQLISQKLPEGESRYLLEEEVIQLASDLWTGLRVFQVNFFQYKRCLVCADEKFSSPT